MKKVFIGLAVISMLSACHNANQVSSPTEPDGANAQNNSTPVHKTFVDKSNLKWDAAKDRFDKPIYHANDGLSLDDFAKQMQNQPEEFPGIYRNCTSTRINTNAGVSVELIQCEILNDEGQYEKEGCDANGPQGMPIGLFLSIHNAENKSMDVHWLGHEYANCDLEYYWSNDYIYTLEYAYSEPLGDTNAIHAVVRKYSHNDDCEHERAVDGLDCREEHVAGEDRHYIFAGDEYRLVGAYPERILTKTVNGCGIVDCGESLDAELYEINLTLLPDKWQLNSLKQHFNISFLYEDDLEKQRQAFDEGVYCDPPKVLPQYEKYLKYAYADLTFDQEELKPYIDSVKGIVNKTGKIDETFKISKYDIE